MDAMYLAGIVADGAQMTRKQLNDWAEGAAHMQMIAEYTVPWVAVESPHGRELALEWIQSDKEHVASAGWCTLSGLVATQPDTSLDLEVIESLLATIVGKEIGFLRSTAGGIKGAQNRVRYTMNGFVISVGSYVKPLLKQAKAAARWIGAVEVEMGETACKVPLATEYIEKIEAAGRLGQKRKTMRC
jgi:hypothetical protein